MFFFFLLGKIVCQLLLPICLHDGRTMRFLLHSASCTAIGILIFALFLPDNINIFACVLSTLRFHFSLRTIEHMSSSIELLREKGNALSTEQINVCLKDILRDLTVAKDANNPEIFLPLLTNIIKALTPIESVNNYCDHPIIVNVLRDSFLDLLKQSSNETTEHVLAELADFFDQRLASFLTMNSDTKQMLIDALVMFLAGKTSTNIFGFYGAIENPVDRSLHTLLRTLEDRKNENRTLTWLDVLIDCVCSSTFLHTFRSLNSKESDLTKDEELLLIGCVSRVRGYNEIETVPYLMEKIASYMLSDYAALLLEFVPPRKPTHVKVLNHFVNMLGFLAIDNNVRHQFVDDHALFIDSLLTILQDDHLWKHISDSDTNELFKHTINYLFLLSLESDLLPIIKSKPNVTKCMLKLTEATDETTQFDGYRTLAIIMTEDELKRLTEPDKITTVFLKHMTYSIDFIERRRRLENLLLCLKSKYMIVYFLPL